MRIGAIGNIIQEKDLGVVASGTIKKSKYEVRKIFLMLPDNRRDTMFRVFIGSERKIDIPSLDLALEYIRDLEAS